MILPIKNSILFKEFIIINPCINKRYNGKISLLDDKSSFDCPIIESTVNEYINNSEDVEHINEEPTVDIEFYNKRELCNYYGHAFKM